MPAPEKRRYTPEPPSPEAVAATQLVRQAPQTANASPATVGNLASMNLLPAEQQAVAAEIEVGTWVRRVKNRWQNMNNRQRREFWDALSYDETSVLSQSGLAKPGNAFVEGAKTIGRNLPFVKPLWEGVVWADDRTNQYKRMNIALQDAHGPQDPELANPMVSFFEAMLPSTLRPATLRKYWNLVGEDNGEGFFLPSKVQELRDDDVDEAVIEVASEIASRISTNEADEETMMSAYRQFLMVEVAEGAIDQSAAVEALTRFETAAADPELKRTVEHLLGAKVSTGRHIANEMGLDPTSEAYQWISGAGDTASAFADIWWAGGKAVKATRMIRRSVFTADDVVRRTLTKQAYDEIREAPMRAEWDRIRASADPQQSLADWHKHGRTEGLAEAAANKIREAEAIADPAARAEALSKVLDPSVYRAYNRIAKALNEELDGWVNFHRTVPGAGSMTPDEITAARLEGTRFDGRNITGRWRDRKLGGVAKLKAENPKWVKVAEVMLADAFKAPIPGAAPKRINQLEETGEFAVKSYVGIADVFSHFADDAGLVQILSGQMAGHLRHVPVIPFENLAHIPFLRAKNAMAQSIDWLADSPLRTLDKMRHAEKITDEQFDELLDKGIRWDGRATITGTYNGVKVGHGRALLVGAENLVGGILKKAVTTNPGGVIDLTSGEASEQIRALASVFLPPSQADTIVNTFQASGSIAGRARVVRGLYMKLFDQLGILETEKGKEWANKFVDTMSASVGQKGGYNGQIYGLGDHAFTMINGKKTPTAVFTGETSTHMALPDVKYLYAHVKRGAFWKKTTGFNLLNSDMADFVIGRAWTPLVLLRLGFPLRAGGEEALQFIMREGAMNYLRARRTASKVADKPLFDLVHRAVDFFAEGILERALPVEKGTIKNVFDWRHPEKLIGHWQGLAAAKDMDKLASGLEKTAMVYKAVSSAPRRILRAYTPTEYVNAAQELARHSTRHVSRLMSEITSTEMRHAEQMPDAARSTLAVAEDANNILKQPDEWWKKAIWTGKHSVYEGWDDIWFHHYRNRMHFIVDSPEGQIAVGLFARFGAEHGWDSDQAKHQFKIAFAEAIESGDPKVMDAILDGLIRGSYDEQFGQLGGFEHPQFPTPNDPDIIGWHGTANGIPADPVLAFLDQQGKATAETANKVLDWRRRQERLFELGKADEAAVRVTEQVERFIPPRFLEAHWNKFFSSDEFVDWLTDLDDYDAAAVQLMQIAKERFGQSWVDEQLDELSGAALEDQIAAQQVWDVAHLIPETGSPAERWRKFQINVRREQTRYAVEGSKLDEFERELQWKHGVPPRWFEDPSQQLELYDPEVRAVVRAWTDDGVALTQEAADELYSQARQLFDEGKLDFLYDTLEEQAQWQRVFDEADQALVDGFDGPGGTERHFVIDQIMSTLAERVRASQIEVIGGESRRKADVPVKAVQQGQVMMRGRRSIPMDLGEGSQIHGRGMYLADEFPAQTFHYADQRTSGRNQMPARIYGFAFDGEWRPIHQGRAVDRDVYYTLREVADQYLAGAGHPQADWILRHLAPFASPQVLEAHLRTFPSDMVDDLLERWKANADWVDYKRQLGDAEDLWDQPGTFDGFWSGIVRNELTDEEQHRIVDQFEKLGYTGIRQSQAPNGVGGTRYVDGSSHVNIVFDPRKLTVKHEYDPRALKRFDKNDLKTRRAMLEHVADAQWEAIKERTFASVDGEKLDKPVPGVLEALTEGRLPTIEELKGFHYRPADTRTNRVGSLDEEKLAVLPDDVADAIRQGYEDNIEPDVMDDYLAENGLGRLEDFISYEDVVEELPTPRLPKRTWGAETEEVRVSLTEVFYKKPFELIGEMIDYLSREPMMLHHYVEGRRLAESMWGAHPGLKQVLDAIKETSFADGTRLIDGRSGIDHVKRVKDSFFKLRQTADPDALREVLGGGQVVKGKVGDSLAKVKPSTGEITVDSKAIAADYAAGMGYLKGLLDTPGSRQKAAVMTRSGVDVDELKAWFDANGGASTYEEFIILHERAHQLLQHEGVPVEKWLDEHALSQEQAANEFAFAALDMPFGDRDRVVSLFKDNIRTLDQYAALHPDTADFSRIMRLGQDAGIHRTEDMSDLEYLERVFERVWDVEGQVFETAFMHAVNKVTPHIDNKAVRSFLATMGRNVMPFWWAEERFYKRSAQTLFHSPETLMKAQLGYKGLRHAGIIQTDEDGEDYFVYPGVDTMSWLVTKALNFATGGDYKEFKKYDENGNEIADFSDYLEIRGQTKLALPGFDMDQMGNWSPSPLIAVPMRILGDTFPELERFTDPIAGEFASSSSRETWELLLPSTLIRLFQIPNAREHYASAQNEAIKVLVANGFDPEVATPRQREEFLANVHELTQTIAGLRVIYGFAGPAPPQIAFDSLEGPSKELYEFTATFGFEQGIQMWQEKHPTALAYSVLNSYTAGGGSVPATEAAYKWMDEHESFLTKHPLIGSYLYPVPNMFMEDEFSRRAWNKQYAIGLRNQRTDEETYIAAKFAEAAPTYFKAKDEKNAILAQLPPEATEARREVRRVWREWKNDYFAKNPTFAQELSDSSRKDRRDDILADLKDALDDPDLPKNNITAALHKVYETYTGYVELREKLKLRDTKQYKAARQAAQDQMIGWMQQMIDHEPQLEPFFQRVILPDLGISDEEFEAVTEGAA